MLSGALQERREKSIRDREDVYDRRLKLRKATKEAEEKRYFNQHWICAAAWPRGNHPLSEVPPLTVYE